MKRKPSVVEVREKLDAIRDRLSSMVETMDMIVEFRNSGDWQVLYLSWEECMEKELRPMLGNVTRGHFFALMQQAEVAANIRQSDASDCPPPPVLHTKELAKVPAEQQAEVYEEAKAAGGGHATTETVKAAVASAKKAAKYQGPPSEIVKPTKADEKYDAAVARIGAVCGKAVLKALKEGGLSNVDRAGAIFWASLKDDQLLLMQELVVGSHWKPKTAHAFLNRIPGSKTKIGELENLAIAGGGVTMVTNGAFTTITYNTRKFSAESKKVKEIFKLG